MKIPCKQLIIAALSLSVMLTGSIQASAKNDSAKETKLVNKKSENASRHNSHNLMYPVLKKAHKPEDAGFSSSKLKEVDSLIENEIDNGFPGAVLLVIKDGKIVKNTAYGYAKKYDRGTLLKHPKKMKTTTMFDLASNTKMYSVNFALQHLVSQGKIDLNQTVSHYVPQFKDSADDKIKGKDTLRLIDILHHTAGFPPSVEYYNPKLAGDLYTTDRSKVLQMISRTPLDYQPGTKNIYSDLDYMLLGFIIEKVTGKRLDQYAEETLYKPLGLKHTLFNPLQKGFKPRDFAATELNGNTRDGAIYFPGIRTYTLQGEVHDEKAFYSMGGVSGHAGLFSTTGDLAVLLQVILNDGGYGNVQLFDKQTIDRFLAPSDMNPTYGLGWRRNGNSSMHWMFSPYASENAVGHTGWTGTLTIIDREKNLGIVLLTNKKHSPVADPQKDPNKFLGDTFGISQYGNVVTAVYQALKVN